jgi:hypothetical protein
MYYKATIEILVDVETEAEACDCLSETLRPLLREFEPQSSVIDWRYHGSHSIPVPDTGKDFEYA